LIGSSHVFTLFYGGNGLHQIPIFPAYTIPQWHMPTVRHRQRAMSIFWRGLPLVAPWMLVHYKRSVRCGYVCRIRVVVGVCATLSDESGLVGLCAHAPLSARV
jgi:hypothetical protein